MMMLTSSKVSIWKTPSSTRLSQIASSGISSEASSGMKIEAMIGPGWRSTSSEAGQRVVCRAVPARHRLGAQIDEAQIPSAQCGARGRAAEIEIGLVELERHLVGGQIVRIASSI